MKYLAILLLTAFAPATYPSPAPPITKPSVCCEPFVDRGVLVIKEREIVLDFLPENDLCVDRLSECLDSYLASRGSVVRPNANVLGDNKRQLLRLATASSQYCRPFNAILSWNIIPNTEFVLLMNGLNRATVGCKNDIDLLDSTLAHLLAHIPVKHKYTQNESQAIARSLQYLSTRMDINELTVRFVRHFRSQALTPAALATIKATPCVNTRAPNWELFDALQEWDTSPRTVADSCFYAAIETQHDERLSDLIDHHPSEFKRLIPSIVRSHPPDHHIVRTVVTACRAHRISLHESLIAAVDRQDWTLALFILHARYRGILNAVVYLITLDMIKRRAGNVTSFIRTNTEYF